MKSEFFAAHKFVMPHLKGTVVDFGCGELRVTQTAIGVDFARHYNLPPTARFAVKTDATITCGWERFVEFCEEVGTRFDTIFSSHLLEDYEDAYDVLERWLGLLRVGGNIVLVLPIEQEYRRKEANWLNEAHRQDWAGAQDFVDKMPKQLAQRVEVLEMRDGVGEWSFVIVLRRLA